MSVYTTVGLEEASAWLRAYPLSPLESIQAIPTGTVNSNFYLVIDKKRYIFTVFETLATARLNQILSLTQTLADMGLACPNPIPNQSHQLLTPMGNKPAALIECIEGHSVDVPSLAHCFAIGEFLGTLHQHTHTLNLDLPDTMGADWRKKTLQKLTHCWNNNESQFASHIQKEITKLELFTLPSGIIHADLFRDNALFTENKLSGVIDFYFACHGPLLYDLSILINDWCYTEEGFQQEKFDACLAGYQSRRPLTQDEQLALHPMLLLAGFRFWLSRLDSKYFPRNGETVLSKDPTEIQAKLIFYLHATSNALKSN